MKIKKKINASFETLAAFWPPEKPSEHSAGTLSVRKGSMNYLTAPIYQILETQELGEKFMQVGGVQSPPVISCLQGRTQEDDCSIFGVMELATPGVLDMRSGESLHSQKYSVWAAVMGLQLSSSTTAEIDSAVFRFTDIHQWMPFAWGLEQSKNDTAYRIPRKAVDVFSFSSVALEAEVQCEVRAQGRSKSKGKTSLVPVPLIRITPRQPQSLEWFLRLMPRLENFFSLLLGTSVAPKHVEFFRGDDTGWLIKHQRRRRQKPNLQLWVRCEPHVVAGALASWLAVPEDERAIEKTLLGTLRKSSLFVETEFLSLAQALEAFGRLHFDALLIPKAEFKEGLKQIKATIQTLWGEAPVAERCSQILNNANETSFGERLRRTFGLLPVEFLERHFGKTANLAQTVVQTRNFFTHLGIHAGTVVVQGGKEMFLLNQKLTALLRCVMLLELGIPFEHLRDPIAYQAQRWS